MANHERDEQLAALAELLVHHRVAFVLFGSEAGRVQGAELRTIDADIVPQATGENLQRLCDALNSANARWRLDDLGHTAPIEGGRLEPRHLVDIVAMGLVTDVGPVDIVMRPKGFEDGYSALVEHASGVSIGDVRVLVGDLMDLIHSKRLLNREKDREHLPRLIEAAERRRVQELDIDLDRGWDHGHDL